MCGKQSETIEKYVLGIDQSTQGTKVLLFDSEGNLVQRTDRPHHQMIDQRGWVEHNPIEIYENLLQAVKELLDISGIYPEQIQTVGISNQRETALAWNRKTGEPVYNAIVWQCARGEPICRDIREKGYGEEIHMRTGLPLSPYFSAAKLSWILKNVPGVMEQAKAGDICCGTMDSWLVYRLTGRKVFATDYSNASRTQLFHIRSLKWDELCCQLFDIPLCTLAQVRDSNGEYGTTDFEGLLPAPVPIRAVMGDSHGALFGQGCVKAGMAKATYGTGSSVMVNIGTAPILSDKAATSLAWSMDGEVQYVLEGNINYTGAVVTWMKDDLGLINSSEETDSLARQANQEDETYLIPAFSGLGAPYWDAKARAMFCGMSRTTKRAELVKAGLESIAYQITDVIRAMEDESGVALKELRVDGGPTRNAYLMQFQGDIAGIPIRVPSAAELSGIGAAYAAGITAGIYDRKLVFSRLKRVRYMPAMEKEQREKKYSGWKQAVMRTLQK